LRRPHSLFRSVGRTQPALSTPENRGTESQNHAFAGCLRKRCTSRRAPPHGAQRQTAPHSSVNLPIAP